jgi:homoserine kinase
VTFTVRAPATSANLGPGFDCLGLALSLHNEVTADTEAAPGVSWEGEGAGELPTDGSDMTSRAIARTAEEFGWALPSFALSGHNRVPLERGLGSSSAAIIAGVMLAAALAGETLGPETVLELATAIEGHPDNAVPCVLGGFTIAGERSIRLEASSDLRPVALIPTGMRLPTSEARAALPDRVPMADAVFNLSHAALAVVAFTRDPSLLSEALGDRLHQDARLAMVPEVRAVFDDLKGAGVPVCVSGAGPTLMAFPASGEVPDPGPAWAVLPLSVEADGASLLPVP